MFDFDFIGNLDLLSVGVAIAGIGVLGILVYLNDRDSATNRAFLYFALASILWSIFNYSYYQFSDPILVLWLLRIHAFFAVLYTFFLFNLFFVFPKRQAVFPRLVKYILFPTVVVVSMLTLTPFVFKEVSSFTADGRIEGVIQGPGIVAFGALIVFLVISGFIILVNRRSRATDVLNKRNFSLVLMGGIITFILHIIFNLLLPAAFDNPRFVPLGAVFIFPFILFTSYAILRHRLLNIRVAGSAVLVFALSVVTLIEVVLAGKDIILLLFRTSVFTLVLVFGILLIRGVLKEVEQREEIEMLAKDLEKANVRLRELDKLKSEFVSIASHQLRSPLTSVKGYASLILEGSFGKVTDAVKEAVHKIFDSSEAMVASVEDFLNVSRIEQGRMKYEMSIFDVGELTEKVIEEIQPSADKKKLGLSYSADTRENAVKADIGKIKQVINNLIDNAIKYTGKGSVDVRVSRRENMIRITITDTGVGIPKQTLPRLFDRFVRDKDARKVNVSGSGLGLYVAKQLVEGHKGRVWAESEGEGKGSTFYIELPAHM